MNTPELKAKLTRFATDEELSEGSRAILREALRADLDDASLEIVLAAARDALAQTRSADSLIEIVGAVLNRGIYMTARCGAV